ncbi:MAG: CocE/NonD family hydrolase [Gemmatimonadetes bacterium]|nr:CocE/NonD family hydrolase [Gemmatimonadota bacterium]
MSPLSRRSVILGAVAALAAAGLGSSAAVAQTAAEYPMVIRYNVKVAMRDGVRLSADVYRPKGEGARPAIFELTPYNNNSATSMADAWQFVKRGYAFVTVDVRGRYDSDGEFAPFSHDGKDGAAVMSWIAAQAWSNGKVATMGGSYLGKVQWEMAKERHQAHSAIVSYVSPADDWHDGTRFNGVPKLDLMYTWMMGMDGRVRQASAGWNWGQVMRGLPLSTLSTGVGREVSYWRLAMEHDRLDEYWQPLQMRDRYGSFDIPSFNVTGWYEGQLRGQIQNYAGVAKADPAKHMLVVGPWLHGVNRNRVVGERDGGPDAIIDLNGLRDRWLDARMLGATPPELPNVLYFLPVKNEWRTAAAWPIPGTEFTKFYLESGGKSNTLLGDGVLRRDRPGAGPADRFSYDPANPVPSVTSRTAGARGGLPNGAVDHRAVETRSDVLVYTSEPLAAGVEVTGPVSAVIYLATDVEDTDVAVKLLDVAPDGRSLNIAEGIARAKYRNSYSAPEPVVPGKVFPLAIELFPTSTYFEAGHRIRIEVAGSDFPNFGRNLNTMNSETGTEIRVAHDRIEHTAVFPSHIVVPIVPAGSTQAWRGMSPRAGRDR